MKFFKMKMLNDEVPALKPLLSMTIQYFQVDDVFTVVLVAMIFTLLAEDTQCVENS